MKTKGEIKKIAIQCVKDEAAAVSKLVDYVDDDFVRSCELIYNNNEGRVIVCGIGKSANIAQKIVATFNSTGTPAIFMHAADAIHGDLGMVQKHDIVILISKSGNTPETNLLVPMIKTRGNKLIAIVGNVDSYLSKHADFVINSTVSKEASPNNLAPTASSTAQLVLGDALAVCLIHMRGFSKEDFARVHPGGALGKQLYMTVDDIFKDNEIPFVSPDARLSQIIYEISSKRLGVTAVIDKGNIAGIITDGDLRRMLEKTPNPQHVVAKEIMSRHPKTIESNQLAIKALEMMKKHNITSVLVTKDGNYAGVIHLHDLLKEGII
ncbi:MAG: KpsF/GutQ family sugar-phosphate isomerase [Bacteroidales bacterium]|nr:KpsF/GutQ family sugar-phosphate isomerase [Bacteroidales bacterium]MBQ4478017.1 KpsF/GutQ family sugar-phosphate isomerase [Bacteroidales bacterium]MCR5555511.1 KpsF/GutQ family sugar-phosphate isomerase [Bacteroidales bacterium]